MNVPPPYPEIIAGNDPRFLRHAVGAKALGLHFLVEKGFRVPPFFVIPSDAALAIGSQPDLLPGIISLWQQSFAIMPDSLWAVRSSAEVEDGLTRSFAGQFHTEINVAPAGLPSAIAQVLAGFQAVAAADYHTGEAFGYGVILQEMLRPDYSGVIFSHNPLDPLQPEVHINLLPGLGEPLVSGKETAFSVVVRGPKVEYLNPEEDFQGEIFQEKIQPVHRSGRDIATSTTSFYTELAKGARRLAAHKGFPIDAEFAIADGHVYWLQVRPMTSRAPEKVVAIWDNANISENYPGLTLPLSVSFVQRTYYRAYRAMALFLGMSKRQVAANDSLLSQMSGAIDGAMYYHVTAWQQLLYQLPFGKRTSKLITHLWNTTEALFDAPATRSGPLAYLRLLFNLIQSFLNFGKLRQEYLALYDQAMAAHQATDYAALNHEGLVTLFDDLEKKLSDNWVAPMLNGFFTMIFFSLLRKMVNGSRLAAAYPNFTNDILFAQGDVVSVQIVRDYQALLRQMQKTPAIREMMLQTPLEVLPENLAGAFPEFKQQIDLYLERFGERVEAGELKLEIKNYHDEPLRFYEMLKAGSAHSLPEVQHDTRGFDWQKVLRAVYPWQWAWRALLSWVIRATVPRFRDRENFRFMRTKTFGIARALFRAMDADLLRRGFIDGVGDSLYLHLSEINDPAQAETYRGLIAERKAQYADYATVSHASRYHQTSIGFEAVEIAPPESDTAKKGIGCSSGIVTARVAIITDGNPDRDLSGCLLVARAFEPGWVNLFSQAAGVISERGNLLSHTAILCREMGIPAIVGAKGLLTYLHEGDTVWMNGATGEYHLVSDEK